VREAIEVSKTLRSIRASSSGAMVLHHGCSAEINSADVLAHEFARNSGWQIEGHPACVASGEEPRQLAHVRKQLSVLHPAQRLGDRDASLIWAADIIVAVRPRLSQTRALLAEAAAIGWQVILIDVPGPGRPAVPAQAEPVETIDWTPRIHNYLVHEHR
jgi:hypothetical protein